MPSPFSGYLPWAAAGLALLLRLPFLTSLPPSWDSVQFTLAVTDYNVAMHQPHPPGYLLYVLAAQSLHALGLSPYAALLVLSLVPAATMTGLLCWWAGRLAGPPAALAAALLGLLSPLAWWTATVGETYSLSGCLAAVTGYLCWRLYRRPAEPAWPSALVLAVVGGVRPTDALFLLPLWLYCTARRGLRAFALGFVVFALTSALWVSGLLLHVGGLERYRALSEQVAARWLLSQAPLAGHWGFLFQNLDRFGSGALLALAVAWVFVPFARGTALTRRAAFLTLWIAPLTLFCLAVHTGRAGYLMLIFPPLVLLAAVGLARVTATVAPLARGVLFLLLAVLLGAFTYSQVFVTLRQQDRDFRALAAAARASAPGTVVLTTAGALDTGPRGAPSLPFRAAMYLLPEAPVYRFPLESVVERFGGGPNAGLRHHSSFVAAPRSHPGARRLLLLDETLLRYLPPGTPARRLLASAQGVLLEVPLDPTTPLVLGPADRLSFRPLPVSPRQALSPPAAKLTP